MQITIDTNIDSRMEALAIVRCLGELYGINTSSIEGVISHADNPMTGAMPSRESLEQAAKTFELDPNTAQIGPAVFGSSVSSPASAFSQALAQHTDNVMMAGLAPGPEVFGGAVAPVPPAPPAPPTVIAPAAFVPATSPTFVPAQPTVAAAPSGGVELDKNGLPWDGRIHSESRSVNKDGSWRAKRGLNDGGLVKKVEAELRAIQALPAAVPAAPPAAAVTFGTVGNPPPPPSAPMAPPVPSAAPAQPESMNFIQMMNAITPALSQNRITVAMLSEACASQGIPSLPLLATRSDLVPAVYKYLTERVTL
jgi:hypothetical protein